MSIRAIVSMIGVLFAPLSLGEPVHVNTPGDGFLALRSEPSAKHGVRLSKIPHGAAIELSECVYRSSAEHWCKTTYQGTAGWVLDKYVTNKSNRRNSNSIAGQGRQTSIASENNIILKTVDNECTPNWCIPAIDTVLGGYATVSFICKKKDCENSTAYLKKTGSKWTMVDQGTGITPDDLVSYGFPANVAGALAQ